MRLDKKTIRNNKDKLYCDFTFCIYNSACCGMPSKSKIKNCHCKNPSAKPEYGPNSEIDLCTSFIWDGNKKGICSDCQMEEYGEINLSLLKLDIKDSIIEDMEDEEL